MNYQDENAYKNGLNNTSSHSDEGPAPDILYEKGKSFLSKVLFVFSLFAILGTSQVTSEKNIDYTGFSGIFKAFAIKNSHFLDIYKSNVLPLNVYKILIIIALALLCVCALINAGTSEREKKYIIKKQKIEGEISRDERLRFDGDPNLKKLNRLENSRRALNIFLFFLTIINILLFAVIFGLSGFQYVFTEIAKPDIDRTIGGFRLFMNLISSLCQTLSICIGLAILPFVVRNRTIINNNLLKVIAGIGVFSTIHSLYFFFGHFTGYPSSIDFSFAVITGAMAGFAILSVATENKKKILREFSNSRFNIF